MPPERTDPCPRVEYRLAVSKLDPGSGRVRIVSGRVRPPWRWFFPTGRDQAHVSRPGADPWSFGGPFPATRCALRPAAFGAGEAGHGGCIGRLAGRNPGGAIHANHESSPTQGPDAGILLPPGQHLGGGVPLGRWTLPVSAASGVPGAGSIQKIGSLGRRGRLDPDPPRRRPPPVPLLKPPKIPPVFLLSPPAPIFDYT